jgi:cytochrome P450
MQISDVYFDPYDAEIHRNPYPTYQRLRDEAPLYYNERHDFYAVSRYDDVERGLADRQTFISGRGNVLEFIKSGAQMPPGIPEADQVAIRDKSNATMRTKAGKGMRINQQNLMLGGEFAAYIDWRTENPSDDIMTDLLNAEFEDHDGTRRRLTRQELLTYVYVIAGAGNETSARLIGWTAKVLADHPDQRRALVEDRSLIPNAIEEVLRFENPAPIAARSVAADVELHGEVVPAGAAIVILMGAANRDERKYLDPNRFDIKR